MPANESKAKLERRPLRDSSNIGRFSLKSVHPKKFNEKPKVDEEDSSFRVKKYRNKEENDDDGEVDRLFLVHMELSSVLRQIDELVVQSTKLQTAGKNGRKEIKSFRSALSEILSLLKPWVPRFQELVSSPLQVETLKEQSLAHTTKNEDEPFEVESPEQTRFESLISPSPLVSWRGDFNIDGGRQLFLLTPLVMSKAKSRQVLSASAFEMINSNAFEINPLDNSKEASDGLQGGKGMNATVTKPSGSVAAMTKKSKLDYGLVSSPIFKKKTHSELLLTPCLKMSPPKSCVLLEPASQSCPRGKGVRKSTPYPIGLHNLSDSEASESSGTVNSAELALKYPELLGIQRAPGIGKKDLESSLDWWFSPPKTCILLEPSDEKSVDEGRAEENLRVSRAFREHKEESPPETKEFKELVGGGLVLVESTPSLKEPDSMMRMGRRAAESTLKRELWTKFEAASSTYGLGFTAIAPGNSKKGFLDMLEEVSGNEEASSPPVGMR